VQPGYDNIVNMSRAILESLRPKQWPKNIVIFAGLIFDGQLTHPEPFLRVLLAVIIFCLISGVTYLINDLLDLEADQMHPVKRNRALASGRISKKTVLILIAIFVLISFPLAFLLSPMFGFICVAYTLLMLAYSKFLKNLIIIDVIVLALGFILRVAAGITVIKVEYFSPWLFVLTTLLALFLGFGKRLSELKLLQGSAGQHRKVLEGYSIPLLNQYLNILLGGILITYAFYTFWAHPSGNNYAMMATIPFVVYGLFRYLYILHTGTQGATPEEVLLKDHPLQISILLWGLTAIIVIYFFL
jgi:4-hydroxybenzoate polyprenyltransferase